MEICAAEKVEYVLEGLEAIIFTAEGDMRQAVNNLQSTVSGNTNSNLNRLWLYQS